MSGATSNKNLLAVITLSQQHDKQDVLPNSSSGFGFGMLCLTVSVSVSVQTKLIPKPKPKLKFWCFGFGSNSGFGRLHKNVDVQDQIPRRCSDLVNPYIGYK